jgi:hypothetical protein
MIERQYENNQKVYVRVAAEFSPEGKLIPVAFWWENGRRYTIDRVVDACRAASLKAGGIGIRYTCIVRGQETFLYYDESRWFMERKGA